MQETIDNYQINISKTRKYFYNGSSLLSSLEEELKSFSGLIPLVHALKNEKLQRIHFEEINSILNKTINL